jgi:predicted acetyltransferase
MKQKLKLVLPSKKYLKSYQNFCRDFIKNGTGDYPEKYAQRLISAKKPQFLKWLRDDSKGVNLEKGAVQMTTYWGIVNDKVVGRVNLRHKLNRELREGGGHIGSVVRPSEQRKGYATEMALQVLKKAKVLGFKKVLRTCNSDNIASRKLIEKTGGIFENEVICDGVKVRRYWVKL